MFTIIATHIDGSLQPRQIEGIRMGGEEWARQRLPEKENNLKGYTESTREKCDMCIE